MTPAAFTSKGEPPRPKSARGVNGMSARADEEVAATAAATRMRITRDIGSLQNGELRWLRKR
jgi:hypothetical protein